MLNLQEVPGRSWWDCAKPPLCHIGANPLTTSYFIHHRRQFVQQCRGINPGFSDGGRYFLLRASFTFPQLFTSQVLWGGEAKKGKWHASASAIIKEAERSGLFPSSYSSEFLYHFTQEPLSVLLSEIQFWENENCGAFGQRRDENDWKRNKLPQSGCEAFVSSHKSGKFDLATRKSTQLAESSHTID